MFGSPVALVLKKPFFMLRKSGKMPNVIESASYTKEYKVGRKEYARHVILVIKQPREGCCNI